MRSKTQACAARSDQKGNGLSVYKCIYKLFRRPSEQVVSSVNMREMPLRRLWWLADAPLFIDERLLASFYDAVVRPEFELQGKTIGAISEKTHELLVGGSAGAEIGLPAFLTTVIPGAKANAKLEGKLERKTGGSSQSSEQEEWKPVQTAGRKLEELIAVYVANHRFHDRLLFMDCPNSSIQTLAGDSVPFECFAEGADSFPRALVFLEVKPGAKIIPTMCEFTDGGLAPLYERLISKLWSTNEQKPQYPGAATQNASEERRAYWNAISERYDSRIAMEVLEASVEGKSRLDWIDFRLRLGEAGETLHLHTSPRGVYSAGTFGYNFIRRGDRKGVRIVGALKRGPDLNVLAMFEC